MAFTFSESSGRFVNERGRFVSERAVRGTVDAIADGASERMARASERLLNGELSLGSWQAEIAQTLKLAHLAAGTIAHGGAAQMTFSRYGALGQIIRSEYGYLRSFAQDIASGRQPLTGSLTARARQYGQASRVAFERAYGRDQQARGYAAVKNVMGAAEHCDQCRSLAARGWLSIGEMPPIGSRTCRANDRCRLVYSRDMEAVA